MTPAVTLSSPTPPTSMAPSVTVVTPGTVRLLAAYVVSTAVLTAVSKGVTGSTPVKAVMPAPQRCGAESCQV